MIEQHDSQRHFAEQNFDVFLSFGELSIRKKHVTEYILIPNGTGIA